jgi:hypothetical protein
MWLAKRTDSRHKIFGKAATGKPQEDAATRSTKPG